MAFARASNTQIQIFIDRYPFWSVNNDKLHRKYVFDDFVQAFAFMKEAALIAESTNHHPQWLNDYQRVTVDLTTHEAGGITERDFALAETMEEIATKLL